MSAHSTPPSAESPLQGGCLCGAVRYEVTEPFLNAGYCHCTHCQKRTGTGSSVNARVAQSGFRLLQGEQDLRSFTPAAGGRPKVFCASCGSAVFSGEPLREDEVSIRLGTLDVDPHIRPEYRQYLDSAASWEAIPDDGLTRYPGSRGF
jgi:hypothetical protein